MSDLPPCPHCGQLDHVYRNVRAYGWCQEFFDLSGRADGLETDVGFTNTKTLRCASCNKKRYDLTVDGPAVGHAAQVVVKDAL